MVEGEVQVIDITGLENLGGVRGGPQFSPGRDGVIEKRNIMAARVAAGLGINAEGAVVELDLKAGFLESFAYRRPFHRLADLDVPAGDGPAALERVIAALD